MNERGEAILLSVLILALLSGLLTLCGLELQHSFGQLRKRSELFLCAKEFKGELHQHLKIMGQTNWGLKNLSKIQILSVFIPGLQGVALSGKKIKKILKGIQVASTLRYVAAVTSLTKRHCPLPPNAYRGIFKREGLQLKRGRQSEALLRSRKWTYLFYHHPYLLEMSIDATNIEGLHPHPQYAFKEKGGKSFSLYSSQ